MSYILSALKKAEESRGGQPGAPLSPVALPAPASPLVPGSGRWPRWWWLAALAALGLVAAAVLWRPALESSANPRETVTASPPAPEVGAVEAPLASTPVVNSPVVNSPVENSPVATSPASPVPAPPPNTPIPPPRSAPPPPLAITGYIYFDGNPAASKLFVDGVVHRQGSSPGPGMVIRDFRPDRVIIAYRGALHEVPVR